ncbi:hypothetical protein D3C71_2210380 [compost metagenome]
MHSFHKGNIRKNGLLMRGDGISHQFHGANTVLNGVQKRQPGEYTDGQLLLLLGQCCP